jgi:hypothetical protein
MEGQAHWLTLGVVVGGGLLVLLVAFLMGRWRHRTWVTKEFHCPYSDVDVTCEMSKSTLTGRMIDVDTCSKFDPPERVSCERKCVDMLNQAT